MGTEHKIKEYIEKWDNLEVEDVDPLPYYLK